MPRAKQFLMASLFAVSVSTLVAQTPPAAPPAATPPAAAAAPMATTDLYPLKTGSKWTYKLGDAQTVTIVVDAIKDGEATLSTQVNGKAVAKESVKVQADGVYRTKINDTAVTPPVKFLALPAAKDAKWVVDSKVTEQPVKGTFTVKDLKEKIKTKDNKEYEAVVVDGPEFDIAGQKTSVKQWFSPTKGLVKLSYVINNYESTIELVEYVEGK
jgi:hypothetical protein